MTVRKLIAELQKCNPDKEVRIVGSEEDIDLWEVWDMDVNVSSVTEHEHVELLARPWVLGGWDEEDE